MLNFLLQPAGQSSTDLSPPNASRRINVAELKSRHAAGMTIRLRREWKNPTALDFLAECVARCRDLGKLYTILVVSGDVDAPTAETHLVARERFIDRLAALYAADPLCWGVHAGVSYAPHSEELFGDKNKRLSPAMIAANQRLIKYTAQAFARQVIITAGAANDPAAMRQIFRYGIAVAPGRYLYKNNAMSAKSPVDWASNVLVIEAMKLGARGGFEMLCGSNESRFKDPKDKTPQSQLYAKAMAVVAEIEKRAGKKIDYLAPYRADFGRLVA